MKSSARFPFHFRFTHRCIQIRASWILLLSTKKKLNDARNISKRLWRLGKQHQASLFIFALSGQL